MAFCFFSYFLNNKKFIIFHLPYISLCILCSQNHSKTVPKRLPPTVPFFHTTNNHHFTSKNSHHVVPLIPRRCTQNSSQTIPKTTPFFPKNTTSFISKTTSLYLQNSTETTMKTPQKWCKTTPRWRCSSSSPTTCSRRLHHDPRRRRLHVSTITKVSLTQDWVSYWWDLLPAPPLIKFSTPALHSYQSALNPRLTFLLVGSTSCTPLIKFSTPALHSSQNALN